MENHFSNGRLTLKLEEIQALTGWGRDYIRALIREKKLPNVGNTKRFLVPRVALMRYLENGGEQ
jgi:excisionase family DNA binding protein